MRRREERRGGNQRVGWEETMRGGTKGVRKGEEETREERIKRGEGERRGGREQRRKQGRRGNNTRGEGTKQERRGGN